MHSSCQYNTHMQIQIHIHTHIHTLLIRTPGFVLLIIHNLIVPNRAGVISGTIVGCLLLITTVLLVIWLLVFKCDTKCDRNRQDKEFSNEIRWCITYFHGLSAHLMLINRYFWCLLFCRVFKERTLLPRRVALPVVSQAFAQVWPTVKWTNPKKNTPLPLTPVTALQSMTADSATQCDSLF